MGWMGVELDLLHRGNLAIHIGAGSIGILVGVLLLIGTKGSPWHRKWGKVFAYCSLVVSATAILGIIFFRFLPLFALLTVLTVYQLISGWRCVRRKGLGPSIGDGLWTLAGVLAAVALFPSLVEAPKNGSTQPVVIYSTLGALVFVLGFDSVRWFFPVGWYAVIWQYEHVYKLMASFSALVSAFVGNVVRFGQPWSQVLPSFLGLVLIGFFFVQIRFFPSRKVQP